MSESVHASDSLTTSQTHEDTPNPIDVKSQDRASLIVWSPEGILLQARGFPTVGKEDGGILRWRDQEVRDDVGMDCRPDDGNHDDSDLS